MPGPIWQYANNGAISHDGLAQLSGVDRTRYLVRFGAEFVLLTAENSTVGDVSRAVVTLSQPMDWITENGPRAVSDAERSQLRSFLEVALPVIGRRALFD